MKNGKWMRLGMGLCILLSLLFLQGTGSGKGCMTCSELLGEAGYLKIYNNTIYIIEVSIQDSDGTYYGPYRIVTNPPYIVTPSLSAGMCKIWVFVWAAEPFNEMVAYTTFFSSVPDNWKEKEITITVPIGYVPIPGKS